MNTLFGHNSATLSPCGRYRYTLARVWDATLPQVAWVMLNPSTADAHQDDPTIRRCMGFSRAWGAGGIVVVNLFALRSTDPAALYDEEGPDPVAALDDQPRRYGPANRNDEEIVDATDGRRVIAAWGCHGAHLGRDRQVMALLSSRLVECLGVTKDGHPRHPLYVAGATAPRPFELKGGAA